MNSLKPLANNILWTIFVGAGGLLLTLYTFQNRLVYVPNMPPDARTELLDPRTFDLKHFEDVILSTPDNEKLFCWLFKTTSNSREAPTILFFHGNAGNIGHRLPNIKELVNLLDCNVFIVEYRGYGRSTGEASENGIKIDAVTALTYLHEERKDINKNKILLFGRSLGGAVAVFLGGNYADKISAIILENTFTSVPDMMNVIFPALSWFTFLCTNKWYSRETITRFSKPTLFLAGEKDDLVPHWMMKSLYKSCSSPVKRWESFPGGEHMDTWNQPRYYQVFREFVNSFR